VAVGIENPYVDIVVAAADGNRAGEHAVAVDVKANLMTLFGRDNDLALQQQRWGRGRSPQSVARRTESRQGQKSTEENRENAMLESPGSESVKRRGAVGEWWRPTSWCRR
jgi:hypothetical protein